MSQPDLSEALRKQLADLDALKAQLLIGPEVTGQEVGAIYRWLCFHCMGRGRDPHHLIPRSLGGTWQLRNMVFSCGICHDVLQEDPLSKALAMRQMADDFLVGIGRGL